MNRSPTTAILLSLLCTTALSAQISFGGCRDAMGRPVPNVPNPQLQDIAMATLAQDGSPLIIYNPMVVQQNAGPVARFFYLHECAHHALGQIIRDRMGRRNPIPFANEQEADCAAIVFLVKTHEFGADEVSLVQDHLSGSPGDWSQLPGPVRATSLADCLSEAGVALEESDRETTYTIRFRMWTRYGGTPASFDLIIDEENQGTMSNTEGNPILEVSDLARGEHSFELSDLTAYGPYGVIDSGRSCSGRFRVSGDASLTIWARLTPSGDVRCGVR